MRKVIKLQQWEMIDGNLEGIRHHGEFIVIELNTAKLLLPKKYIANLSKLIGKTVAILRTDIPDKEYIIAQINTLWGRGNDQL